jgi:hypothetical protein
MLERRVNHLQGVAKETKQRREARSSRIREAESTLVELANLRVEVEALRPNPPHRVRQNIRAYINGRKSDITQYVTGFHEDLAAMERRLERMIQAHPDTQYWSDNELEGVEPEEQPEETQATACIDPADLIE